MSQAMQGMHGIRVVSILTPTYKLLYELNRFVRVCTATASDTKQIFLAAVFYFISIHSKQKLLRGKILMYYIEMRWCECRLNFYLLFPDFRSHILI